MEFIALHFGNKLKIVNPTASIGLVCLWSNLEFVLEKLSEGGVDIQPTTSKIALIGNLYGNGLPQLLRNLLYNPQISDILIFGSDRSGSAGVLQAFFERGLESTESLGESVTRVAGTKFIIDSGVTPDMFGEHVRVHHYFGDPHDEGSIKRLRIFLENYTPPNSGRELTRLEVPLPEVKVSHYPSDPASHCISADAPLSAWKELIHRITRFGHCVHLRKGERQELQNVKVLIRHPVEDNPADLEEFGFDVADLAAYQSDITEPERPSDQPYTYGNRILRYYGFDALEKFAQRLSNNPQDRDCYLALWDSFKDIDAEDSPCMVSLFFRVFDDSLTLTATYRTHNALDAWLKNVYGLMKLQQIVSELTGIAPGQLTVISHSISVDPARYEKALRVGNSRKFAVNMDPNGHFTIGLENDLIVVRHFNPDGQPIKEYRAHKAERLQHELYLDCAISDIGHAMYIGRQLARAEECLESGREFIE